MTCPPQVWGGVLPRLADSIARHEYEAWIAPLEAELEDDTIRLACPSPFHRRRLEERYLERVRECVEAEAGRPLEIVLGVASATPRAAGRPRRSPVRTAAAAPARPSGGRSPAASRTVPFSFGSFIVGPPNALAREASLALAHSRMAGVNPLFLTSTPGLGKTHLARARVGEAAPPGEPRPRYTTAAGVTPGFARAQRTRRLPEFKRRFREQCDLLVIEDVEFFDSKSSTQLELFHTLVHVLERGGRVALTGDRLPLDIPNLERRLRSQMTSGLVAEIEAPDLGMRREILARKAAAGGVRLPDACVERLAVAIEGSVRDLESALGQVVATAALLGRPVDLELTERALQKVAGPPRNDRPLEPRQVVELVAAFFGTTPAALASRSRRRDVLLPRQLAMYLCRRYTTASLQEIGNALGRDHPSVRNAIARIERQVLERAPLRYQVEARTSRLDGIARGR